MSDEIEDWLRRLKWSLAALDAKERDDIVAEARAHLADATASGRAPAAALAGFGPAEDYARGFVDEMELARALGSGATGSMAAVIARRAHRSAVAALASIALAVLSGAALAAVVMIVTKLFDPVHAGLWRGTHEFFIGTIDDPKHATELLGLWLYPLALAAIASAWLVGRIVLMGALKTLARPR